MEALEPVDTDVPGFGDLYDELPLWSAPFGLWLLERCPLGPGLTTLDIGSMPICRSYCHARSNHGLR